MVKRGESRESRKDYHKEQRTKEQLRVRELYRSITEEETTVEKAK
jgi:hypothetical protein